MNVTKKEVVKKETKTANLLMAICFVLVLLIARVWVFWLRDECCFF